MIWAEPGCGAEPHMENAQPPPGYTLFATFTQQMDTSSKKNDKVIVRVYRNN